MNKHKLFETHAHLDHDLYKGQGPVLAKELYESGVDWIVIPAITEQSNQKARELFDEENYPFVLFAAGIHPKVASSIKDDNFDWDKLTGYLSEERTVAVKTGLDLSPKNLTDKNILNQKHVLRHLLKMADEHNLPAVLHVRDAIPEIIEEIGLSKFSGRLEVHCFLYDLAVMNKLIQAGVHYFGIGGGVTFPENIALREAVAKMPLESILLETDSPFQKPYQYDQKLNTSYSLMQIAKEIATIKGIALDEVISATYDNSIRFFRLYRNN